ncbi:MAG: FemAB family PEP-CTERM system-associated protein [Candidatus Theseobacter exili]|nr:FemAB family PEP-CTERM system-associated protein [Candidatus Theseobacter exili]
MAIIVKNFQTTDAPAWDAYVYAHPHATLYHLSGWRNIILKTYGHKVCYLMAVDSPASKIRNSANHVVGILPLVHIKHYFFGNSLISIPFFDLGGILADNEKIEQVLLLEAIRLGQELKVKTIELRHEKPLKWFDFSDFQKTIQNSNLETKDLVLQTRLHKVRMPLDLLGSSEVLMKHFKPRLRTKIRKSLKEDLRSEIGGVELLNDFYQVFSTNMRDLGSPVHSKKLMRYVLEEFPMIARIVMIYRRSQPIACSLVIGFGDSLESPWVSSIRKYTRLSPNILLYWTMMEYARDSGFASFEFGRSSPGEGTYRFKQQWGARPVQLCWHNISFDNLRETEEKSERSKFEKAIQCWKKLPVPVTKIIGPMIRKYIGL